MVVPGQGDEVARAKVIVGRAEKAQTKTAELYARKLRLSKGDPESARCSEKAAEGAL